MALKQEYRQLYQQRDYIQSRMNEINAQLPTEVREALVREIEDPQLTKLKRPSGPDAGR